MNKLYLILAFQSILLFYIVKATDTVESQYDEQTIHYLNGRVNQIYSDFQLLQQIVLKNEQHLADLGDRLYDNDGRLGTYSYYNSFNNETNTEMCEAIKQLRENIENGKPSVGKPVGKPEPTGGKPEPTSGIPDLAGDKPFIPEDRPPK